MFGLLKDKIPLVCWSQGSGYSLSVSIGSLYGVRPNQIPPKGKFSQKKTANYPYFVDKGGGLYLFIKMRKNLKRLKWKQK